MRVIDSKKIDITNDEWDLYEKICASYTNLTNNGRDLFIDLFETDDNGMIVFLKPPSSRQTSLEVYLYLTTIFIHQQLRHANKTVDDMVLQIKTKLNDFEERLKKIENNS